MSHWRKWFWIAVCASLLVRLLIAAALPLSNDEAYHWLWTVYPSAGYYDHPGLFAYVLWPFTALLGHDSEWVIRIPSLIAGTLTPIAVFKLCKDLSGQLGHEAIDSERRAAQAGMLATCLPIFFVMGMYHTGDASVVCVWAWSLVYANRALHHTNAAWPHWLLLGICTGLGLQAKYLFFMFVPLFGAYLLCVPSTRHWALKPHPYIALLIGLLIFSPNLYWNMQNGWATFEFNFAKRHDKVFEIKHVTEFLFGTLLIGITPGLCIYGLITYGKQLRPTARPVIFFLATFSLLPIAYFLYRSFGQRVGFHWPTVSYVAFCAVAPLYWNPYNVTMTRWWRSAASWSFIPALLLFSIILSLAVLIVAAPQTFLAADKDMHYSERINTEKIGEIYGWRELGEWVNSQQGDNTFLCGPQYGFVAQVSFYTPGNPHVYLWESKRTHGQHFKLIDDFTTLVGKDAVFIAKDMQRIEKKRHELAQHFERLDTDIQTLDIQIGEQTVRQFALLRCYNFNGRTPAHWDSTSD